MATSSPSQQDRDRSSHSGMTDWAGLMREGRRLVAADTPAEAATCFVRASGQRPDHIPTLLDLGAAQLKAGRNAEALDVFATILDLDPHQGGARHGEGLARFNLGDRDGALTAFRRVVTDDRKAWTSWRSIADLTPYEDERLAAITATAEALQALCRNPRAAPIQFVRCADALMDAHLFDTATAFILSNRSRFGDASTAYDRLARATYRLGAFRSAFDLMVQALAATGPGPAGGAHAPPVFNPDAALGALREVGDILSAHGVQYFLAGGTLLGCVRNGGPLPHDRDIDIGLFRDGPDAPDPVNILRAHPALMLTPSARPGDRYASVRYQGIAIDIFLHDHSEGAVVCGFSHQRGDIQWRLSPFHLGRACFGGATWNVPDRAERYLADMYGRTWRRPDTGFASVVSSPALFEVNAYARAFYSVARARKCRLSGDAQKAEALLRQSPIPVALNHHAIPSACQADSQTPAADDSRCTPGESP